MAETTLPTAKDTDSTIITADGSNSYIGDVATADDNVVVKRGEATMYADHVIYNRATKVATAHGNVRLYANNRVYRGEHLTYNFVNKAITSTDFLSQEYPKYIGGKEVSSPEDNHYRIKDGYVTTSDRQDPTFRLQASTVEYRPNDEVVLKNILVYIGKVPVFYIPFYVQSLVDSRPAYEFQLGESGRYGYFIQNQFNFVVNSKMRGSYNLDYRSTRGIGTGVDVQYYPSTLSDMLLKTYFVHDDLYAKPDSAYPNLGARGNYNNRNVLDGIGNQDRFRVDYEHHLNFGNDLTSIADIGIWSDPWVTRDFFPAEYSKKAQPDAVATLNQSNPNFNLTLLIRANPNPFFEQVNRLPELTLDTRQQKIFNSPVEYLSQSSLVNFQRKFASVQNFRDPNSYFANAFKTGTTYPGDPQNPAYDIAQQSNYSAFRYDTYHEFSYPHQYFNFLSLTPRIGGRLTYYSDKNTDLNDTYNGTAQSYDDVKNPALRAAVNAGLEGDFKVSRTWENAQAPNLGINGIRHVLEPFFNSQFAPEPTVTSRQIRPFDARLVSDQLQPLNYPDYNSIDSIDKQAVVRYGVNNEIQTKRDGKNFNLVDWSTYMDADFDHNFSSTPGHTLSNLYNDIKFNPLSYLSFQSLSSTDVGGLNYNEVENSATWQPDPSVSLTAGEAYINHSPLFGDSNLATLGFFYRINEHWQIQTQHQFELQNSSLQLQQYTLYRDLEAWQLAMSYSSAQTLRGVNDSTVYFSLTLKALPQHSIKTPRL